MNTTVIAIEDKAASYSLEDLDKAFVNRKKNRYVTFDFENLLQSVARQLPKGKQKKLQQGVKITHGDYTLCYQKGSTLSLKGTRYDTYVIYNLNNFIPKEKEHLWGTTAQEKADSLFGDLIENGLLPKHWKSTAGIASAVMEAHGVDKFVADHDDHDDKFYSAYYGARIEAYAYGLHEGPAYQYDLNAAYAAAMEHLPNPQTLVWERWKRGEAPKPYGVYYVRYSGPEGDTQHPHPFPHRQYVDGESVITFPHKTEGWYWGVLVKSAKKYVDKHGGRIEIVEGINGRHDPYKGSREYPFGFVSEFYRMRLDMRESGNRVESIVKTLWQTMYGKTCQQRGWKSGNSIPKFFELRWAGYITAFTQARMLDAISQNPKAVVMALTDALFTTEPLDLPVSSDMGNWKCTEYTGLAVFGIGRYMTREGSEWRPAKYAGIRLSDKSYGETQALSQLSIDVIREYMSRGVYDTEPMEFQVTIPGTFDEYAGTPFMGKDVTHTYKIECWDHHGKRYHDMSSCSQCAKGEYDGLNGFHFLESAQPDSEKSAILLTPWIIVLN